ncbi:MAG TPA: hypothetical protein DEO59_03285 [Balneola sp.]|nr:hypothetical protein [Balneola sp.]MAO77993.1 hypothetical protein [Balneola sp.]MBF65216.1 hypothetical protein [Balneola sp.]HAW82134.1 hypothetical protein [Balneola sp.]HBZ37527.1 hypothetical protein [Balneola sp.]
MDEIKDIWDKLEIIGSLASGILIPFAIFLVGFLYNKRREKSELLDRESERISRYLQHLTSSNEKERLAALQIAKYLKNKKQLPNELISAIETLSITDEYTGQVATDLLSNEQEIDFVTILSHLVRNFDFTQEFISQYLNSEESKIFKWVKSIAITNVDSRNLLLNTSHLIPNESRKSANKLINHYNDWLEGYKNALSEYDHEPSLEDKFDYYRAPNYLYPIDAVEDFRKLFSQALENS